MLVASLFPLHTSPKPQDVHSGKLTYINKNGLFEDVFPIENGDVPLLFSWNNLSIEPWYIMFAAGLKLECKISWDHLSQEMAKKLSSDMQNTLRSKRGCCLCWVLPDEGRQVSWLCRWFHQSRWSHNGIDQIQKHLDSFGKQSFLWCILFKTSTDSIPGLVEFWPPTLGLRPETNMLLGLVLSAT